MTRERAEALARETLAAERLSIKHNEAWLTSLLLRVTDEEREECAKECDYSAGIWMELGRDADVAKDLAAAIRARAGND